MVVARPGAVRRRRQEAVRAGAVYSATPPLLTMAYVIGTWGAPHRGALLTVALVMLATVPATLLAATRIIGSRWWMVPQHFGAFVSLVGYVHLALFDGGVAGPLGALIPASTLLLATVLLPRAFLPMALLNAIGYGIVVVFGDPAPPGYPLVHALGFGVAALLCLRHSTVLTSLRRRLAESSRTDPLTGCLNRRGFDELMTMTLADAERTGERATLVLLDLDHFKEVNDTHGHQAGDDLLAWAGQELRSEVRPQDAVGRLGGDEFAVLLAGTDESATAEIVGRIRRRLAAGTPSSLGSATFPDDATDGDGLAGVADRRLYADKDARVRHAPTAEQVSRVRARAGALGAGTTVSARERRRHSIADPGWMAIAQTCVGSIYVTFFAGGNPHQAAMAVLCAWGFGTGLALVLGADWLSRARSARPLMLAFAMSAFLSCAGIAALDGGVQSPLGIGILLAIPLLLLGMRPRVAGPVAAAAAALYLLIGVTGSATGGWYLTINLLSTAGLAVACALQGRTAARQRHQLTRITRMDVLTGVLNRRGFGERFAAEIAEVRRQGGSAALLVADLDRFKQVNDVYGHAAGDELLCWVAATLRVGPTDVVGRLGGDEFVVLVRLGLGERATSAVDRLRARLAERTGVSIGAAVLDHDGANFDSLYAAADAELYRWKSRRPAPAAG
jgi:diguanylate cyclase (GGDEF)-like protein